MNHTPGPWWFERGSRQQNIVDTEGQIVAMVSAVGLPGDAPLIAAAPELLDVVRELTVRYHNNYDPELRARDIAGLIPMAYDAIARAEGRQR